MDGALLMSSSFGEMSCSLMWLSLPAGAEHTLSFLPLPHKRAPSASPPVCLLAPRWDAARLCGVFFCVSVQMSRAHDHFVCAPLFFVSGFQWRLSFISKFASFFFFYNFSSWGMSQREKKNHNRCETSERRRLWWSKHVALPPYKKKKKMRRERERSVFNRLRGVNDGKRDYFVMCCFMGEFLEICLPFEMRRNPFCSTECRKSRRSSALPCSLNAWRRKTTRHNKFTSFIWA